MKKSNHPPSIPPKKIFEVVMLGNTHTPRHHLLVSFFITGTLRLLTWLEGSKMVQELVILLSWHVSRYTKVDSSQYVYINAMRNFLDRCGWQPESPRLVLWGKQSPRDGYFQFGFSYNPCPKWRHTQGHLSFLLRTSQEPTQKTEGESGIWKTKISFQM